jgi:hypothetical protein
MTKRSGQGSAQSGRKPKAVKKIDTAPALPKTRKAKKAAAPGTRRQLFTQKLADGICARLADGEGLKAICRSPGMPDESTVRAWALDVDHPFSRQYSKAREIGFHRLADEIIELSDDRSKDVIVHENGTTSIDHEHINRSRLRVDSRKWLLARVLPKLYGDKVQLGGDANAPLTFQLLPGDEKL